MARKQVNAGGAACISLLLRRRSERDPFKFAALPGLPGQTIPRCKTVHVPFLEPLREHHIPLQARIKHDAPIRKQRRAPHGGNHRLVAIRILYGAMEPPLKPLLARNQVIINKQLRHARINLYGVHTLPHRTRMTPKNHKQSRQKRSHQSL